MQLPSRSILLKATTTVVVWIIVNAGQGRAQVAPAGTTPSVSVSSASAVQARMQWLGNPPGDDKLESALNATLDVDFMEQSLRDVVKYLMDKTGVNFHIAAKKLDEASVSPDTPIRHESRGVRLKTLLGLMLRDLGLAYTVIDNTIVITTPEDVENELFARIYDCRDLIDWAGGHGGLTARPAAAQGGETARSRAEDKRAAEIVDIIQNVVATDSWFDIGGGPGTIDNYYGLFVVNHTLEVHREIETFLAKLREVAQSDLPRGVRKPLRRISRQGSGDMSLAEPAGTGTVSGGGVSGDKP